MAISNIKERLDKIKGRISDANFLANKGLANEVGIHIFSYAPQDELIVRDYIERLVATPSDSYKIIMRDLYEILLEILEEKQVLDKIPDMEKDYGKDYLLTEIRGMTTLKTFRTKIMYKPYQRGDVLFLTGIGKVHPFMRVHSLLIDMQGAFDDIPVVIFYPGEYNKRTLILFDKFHDDNHYRAFNLF